MKTWRRSEQQLEPHTSSLFHGTVQRELLHLPEGGLSSRAGVVHFVDGAYAALHSHGDGQIFVCIAGRGFVENEQERVEVEPGMIVVCPPYEKHRHGALEGHSITFLTVSGGEVSRFETASDVSGQG